MKKKVPIWFMAANGTSNDIVVEVLITRLTNSKFVKFIKFEEEFELQAVKFIPPVEEKIISINRYTGLGEIVAVIDSGFNSSALRRNTEAEVDFTSITNDVIDQVGHGTAVAKIIHQCAPGTKLVILKVTNTRTFGETNVIKVLE